MKRIFIVCLLLSATGCALFQTGAPRVSEKDIKESNIFCGVFSTPWSLKPEKILYISNDSNVIKDGSVEISDDCKVKWENNAIPPKPPKEKEVEKK